MLVLVNANVHSVVKCSFSTTNIILNGKNRLMSPTNAIFAFLSIKGDAEDFDSALSVAYDVLDTQGYRTLYRRETIACNK